jgi:hypothetical protein
MLVHFKTLRPVLYHADLIFACYINTNRGDAPQIEHLHVLDTNKAHFRIHAPYPSPHEIRPCADGVVG